jgi:hypothetical protein
MGPRASLDAVVKRKDTIAAAGNGNPVMQKQRHQKL